MTDRQQRGSWRARVAAAAAALVIPLGVSSVVPSEADAQPLIPVGSISAIPAGATYLGALSGTTRMHVDVVLNPRDPAAIASLATEVSTPGSPFYHRYLTTAEFARALGASPSAIADVEATLRSRGLDPGSVSANALSIPVDATAAEVARGFSTSFRHYRLRGGRDTFENSTAPKLPASVAGQIEGVVGLDDLSQPQPLVASQPAGTALRSADSVARITDVSGAQPCVAAQDEGLDLGEGYTANDLASAYDMTPLYNRGDEGAGETIALLEYGEAVSRSDIAAYQACYGTHTSVSYISVDGGPAPLMSGQVEPEAPLDIETVIGLAPQAKILVYQGSDTVNSDSLWYDTLNDIVSQDQAKIVSISYGVCESIENGAFKANLAEEENDLFEEAALEGQSVLAASGDTGSEGCYRIDGDGSLSVSDPASQPFVTAVGGTDLYGTGLDAGVTVPEESPWNDAYLYGSGNGGAGGGGISANWYMPSYQSEYGSTDGTINSQSSGAPCGNAGGYCREVPDVSADASDVNGYLVYIGGQWQMFGGTSAAAPLWASVIALADASCPADPPVGFADPALYWAASPAFHENALWDVGPQAGGLPDNNDFLDPASGSYPALTGYDMATGLGTPDSANLATALCEDGTFQREPGAGSDIAVGAGGAVWVVGTSSATGGYGLFRWNGTGWSGEPGGGVTIAVDASGNPYVINSLRQIYHWTGSGWTHLPGSATDVAVGAGGAVWVVGTSSATGGYGLFRWNGTGWSGEPGGGVTIAVDASGNPYVINSLRQIYHWTGSGWTHLPGSATDVAVGGGGAVWVVGTLATPGGYALYRWNGATWVREPGGGVKVAVDPSGLAWYLSSSDAIYQVRLLL